VQSARPITGANAAEPKLGQRDSAGQQGHSLSSDVNIAFEGESSFSPNYNCGPGQEFPVLRRSSAGDLELVHAHWGFSAPFRGPGQHVINARSETIEEKAMFRSHLENRCVMFVSGFYEWHKEGSRKQPYFIHLKESPTNDDLMPIACVMRSGKGVDGASFVVLTVQASSAFKWCHDRQPAILPCASAVWQWIGGAAFKECRGLLAADCALSWHRVHPMVGSMKSNGPKCIELYDTSKPSGLADWCRPMVAETRQPSLVSVADEPKTVSKKAGHAHEDGDAGSRQTVSTAASLADLADVQQISASSAGVADLQQTTASSAGAADLQQTAASSARVAGSQQVRLPAKRSRLPTHAHVDAEEPIDRKRLVQCPICGLAMASTIIARHADACAEATFH